MPEQGAKRAENGGGRDHPKKASSSTNDNSPDPTPTTASSSSTSPSSTSSTPIDDSTNGGAPPAPGRPSPHDFFIRYIKDHRNGFSSTIANISGVSLVFPLDTIKTHVQTASSPLGGIACGRQIWRKEGPLGFYRGGLLTVCTASAVRSIGFTTYGHGQRLISNLFANYGYPAPIDTVRTPGSLPTPLTFASFGIAGFIAGCVQAGLACPFELTKIASQLSARPMSGSVTVGKGSFAMAKEIYAKFGIPGFYFGFSRHLARDSIGTGVYFASYESIKQAVSTKRGEAPGSQVGVAVAGASCGVCGWVITYPLDRLKTKFQKARLNAKRGERVTIERVDLLTRSAWGGFHLSVLRSAVLSAIVFTLLEQIKRGIDKLE